MDDLQVVEEEWRIRGRQIPAGQLGSSGTQAGPLANRLCLKPCYLPHFIPVTLRQHPKVFLKQVSLSQSLGPRSGEGRRFFLSLVS